MFRSRPAFSLSALIWLTFVAGACRTNTGSPTPNPSPSVAASAARPAEAFGAPIAAGGKPQPIAAVLASPEQFQGRTVLVEGHVRKACSRRGCWMELAEAADSTAPGCRVTFKDYGFFVPTTSAGATAKVEAQLELATVNAASVDHLEREGGTFKNKAADGSAREVRLIATGVELRR
jgi:hypothetical protein